MRGVREPAGQCGYSGGRSSGRPKDVRLKRPSIDHREAGTVLNATVATDSNIGK